MHSNMTRIAVAAAAFLAALVLSSCDAVRAEPYPSHPIRLVLPQPAGGAVDLIARALGDRFTEQMRAPVVVENMPGANGSLAAGAVARAAADGYTLMLAVDSNLVINPSLYHNLSYDSFRDFVPISIIARLHMVLVANPKVEADNVRELIAYAKVHPNKLNYASIGLGTAMHMGMELFKFTTGTEINQVSYRGTAQAMTDVVASIVDIMFTGPPSARSMSEGGRLKLLAVASPGRMALIPDVPTMEEAGVPGYEMASWFGLLAPARTPSAIVERLSQAVKTALDDRKFDELMKAQGLEIVGGTPEAMWSTMQADTEKWAKLIKAIGIEIPQ
jgi:tripartite-type tricarboxylate transporter receptor subunit TctC